MNHFVKKIEILYLVDDTEVILIQRIFSLILIIQFWIFKHFLKIDNSARKIYWDALFAARAKRENPFCVRIEVC